MRLGWGTMVPTLLSCAYLRGSIAVNATDGSFAIAMLPTLGLTNNPIFLQNSGAGTGTWSSTSFTNAAAIGTTIFEARPVSGGIKVVPQVAATSVPGVIYAMSLPTATTNQITASTPNALSAFYGAKFGFGSLGASAVVRPVDPNSFIFEAAGVAGYIGTSTIASTVPVIVGLGFPIGTTIFYECKLNLEGIAAFSDAGAISNPGTRTDSDSDTLASAFPNIEVMWNTIKQWLPDAATVDSVSQGLAATIPAVTRGARTAAALHRALRPMPNPSAAYFAPYPANRMLIEEVA
jgi:hypothetical protein